MINYFHDPKEQIHLIFQGYDYLKQETKKMQNKLCTLLIGMTCWVSGVSASDVLVARQEFSPPLSSPYMYQHLERIKNAYLDANPQASLDQEFGFTSIQFSKDCSASVTCKDGTTLSCSVDGPSTSCGSTANGVGCWTENAQGETVGESHTCSN
jgi:hypothetical protein